MWLRVRNVSFKKWLGSKIAGVSIQGLERQQEYFRAQLEDLQKDQKKMINEYRFMKNQLLYSAPKITISRDNIITLQHRLIIQDDTKDMRAYIMEGFKDTILENNFIDYHVIEDEQSGQRIADATIRIIRP